MKPKYKNLYWILGFALVIIAAVVVYVVYPLNNQWLDKKAFDAQAATYYNEELTNLDSLQSDTVQNMVDGGQAPAAGRHAD